LSVEEQIVTEVGTLGAVNRAVVLGRGFNHSTAFEWGLKLQEMAYVFAHPFSTADFAHGPYAILEPGFPVLAIAVAGAADIRADLARISEEAGARIVTISNEGDLPYESVPIPAGPEWLTPLTAILPAQRLTAELARVRGIDPERPRGLNKVTRTT